MLYRFSCARCGRVTESMELSPSCLHCRSPALMMESEPHEVKNETIERLPPGVWRYRAFLPAVVPEFIVTLGEGSTPLLRADRLGQELGLRNLWIKDESRNPTGSFIDRGSTVLLSHAMERHTKAIDCVTTGNLGASLAAYCARAGIVARVKVRPTTDQGKLFQMLAYGADIVPYRARFSRGSSPSVSVMAANPYLLEGEKTTGFEIIHDLGWKEPDAIVIPIGTGGHLTMVWRSLTQLRRAGLVRESRCKLIGVQLAGINADLPMADLGESEPYFRDQAASAVADSKGHTSTTNAADIVEATTLLARTEGIFAEPSSASVVASLRDGVTKGLIDPEELVVCVVTGAGLKDTRSVSKLAKDARRSSSPSGAPTPFPQIGGTKLRLLRMLDGHLLYGYEMWRQLNDEHPISTASIYQHLAELEISGLVRRKGSITSGGRERVPYELTKRGGDFLRIAGELQGAGQLAEDGRSSKGQSQSR